MEQKDMIKAEIYDGKDSKEIYFKNDNDMVIRHLILDLKSNIQSNPNKTDTILLTITFNEINDDLFSRLSQTGAFQHR